MKRIIFNKIANAIFCQSFANHSSSSVTTTTSYCGTYTFGTTGGCFISLKTVFDSINLCGLCGNLNLELLSTYSSDSEIFPLLPSTIADETQTLPIYFAATGLSITSDSAQTFNLDGVKYLTVDGRVMQAGSVTDLVIANISTSGIAIRFINEALQNQVKYYNIRGVSSSVTGGVIMFRTTNCTES